MFYVEQNDTHMRNNMKLRSIKRSVITQRKGSSCHRVLNVHLPIRGAAALKSLDWVKR